MEQLITYTAQDTGESYAVRDQEWTEEARRELFETYGVLLHEDSVVALKCAGSILSIGMEDDGVICFKPDAPRFHVHWAAGLVSELEAAIKAAENS